MKHIGGYRTERRSAAPSSRARARAAAGRLSLWGAAAALALAAPGRAQDEAPIATPAPKAAAARSSTTLSDSARSARPALSGGAAGAVRVRDRLLDPLQARSLDPSLDSFPDSSLTDFSDLLSAPAGRSGFVTSGPDGHFHFERGGRARFWGVSVAQEHMDIPKSRIDEAVDNLARAGCNLVRLPAADGEAGLFDGEVRDRLDYWVARLKERGVYSCIVLRPFPFDAAGDGVAEGGRPLPGAEATAFVDEKLIEAHEKFARKVLFDAVNPYTGLALGRDPAVALIEVFHGESLFSRPALWRDMAEPHRSAFRTLWIDYLKRSYGSTEKLREAWTNADGKTALAAGESLEAGEVALPDMEASQSFAETQAADFADPARSPTRRRDGVRFAVELQRNCFRRTLASLEAMGLKVPTAGVVAGASVPDTFSAAQEFGFTAENPAGNSAFDTERGVPSASMWRWSGKPAAVRDWTAGPSDADRAASMTEMASYGRFQDLDALVSSAYRTTGGLDLLSPSGVNDDPVRWGMFGVGARIFLGEETVKPALRTVHVAYSAEDLSTLSVWKEPFRRLSWVHRMDNVLMTPDHATTADLLLMSGRSHAPGYKGQYGLIWSAADWTDSTHKRRAAGSETVQAKSGYDVEARPAGGKRFVFNGVGYEEGETREIEGADSFDAADLIEARLEPFARTLDKKSALGGYDGLRKNLVFGKLPPDTVARMAFGLMNHWYETPTGPAQLDRGLLISDTGELTRDARAGTTFVDTPQVQAILGELTTGVVTASPGQGIEVLSQSPAGAVAALSLDGEPLAESRKYLVKMVTAAGKGAATTATRGRLLEGRATQVRVAGRPLLSVAVENGSWELTIDLDRRTAWLACDTPDAEFTLHLPTDGKALAGITVTGYATGTGAPEELAAGETFRMPGRCKYAEVRF